MNDKQLRDILRRDVLLRIPYTPPIAEQKPYDTNHTSYVSLLPAPLNTRKYAAGAVACVTVLAGMAAAVHFLALSGPGEESSQTGFTTETTASVISTETTFPGQNSSTQTTVTQPSASESASEASATQQTTTQTVSTQENLPTQPVTPPAEQHVKVLKAYGMTDDLYPYVLMENGDLYHWWNHAVEEEHLQRTPEGRKYAKADKDYINVRQYERAYVDANHYYMEMLLTRDGKLSVKGSLPTKNGEYKTSLIEIDPFVKENSRQQDTMLVLADNVKQIQPGLYLVNNGDLYIYGFVRGKAYSAPTKIMDNVAFVYSYGNEIYAIKNSGLLISTKIQKGKDFEWETIGDNANTVGGGGGSTYYITDNGDLYIWNTNSDEKSRTTPTKIASGVSQVNICGMSAVYTDRNRNLYIKDNPDSPEKLIASNVKAFSYLSTLLYIDENDALHGYGTNWNNLRGPNNIDLGEDNIILEDVASFACSGDWAFAITKTGENYSWGANIIGLRYIDDEWFSLPMIDTPFKINPLG